MKINILSLEEILQDIVLNLLIVRAYEPNIYTLGGRIRPPALELLNRQEGKGHKYMDMRVTVLMRLYNPEVIHLSTFTGRISPKIMQEPGDPETYI